MVEYSDFFPHRRKIRKFNEIVKKWDFTKKTNKPKPDTEKKSLLESVKKSIKDTAWHGGKKTKPKPKDKTTNKKKGNVLLNPPLREAEQKGSKVNLKVNQDSVEMNKVTKKPGVTEKVTIIKPKNKGKGQGQPRGLSHYLSPEQRRREAGTAKAQATKAHTEKMKGLQPKHSQPKPKNVPVVQGGNVKGINKGVTQGRPPSVRGVGSGKYDPKTGKPLREGLTIGKGDPLYGHKPKPIAGQPKKRRNR